MKPFALARVLQLAERRSESVARGVKLAHGVWLRARGRQVQLLALRDAHIAQLAGELRGGVTAAQLQESNRLQRAQAAIQQRRIEQRDHDELVELTHRRDAGLRGR
jgi:flagellar biosynthesis chaperone FliJ